MQMNTIYFFIIFLIGILASSFVESKPCNRHNYRTCEHRCRHKGGVRHCEQNHHGHITECRCRRH